MELFFFSCPQPCPEWPELEGVLWALIIAGGFALLGLIAEGVEWFCDAVDDWADSISTHYVDD